MALTIIPSSSATFIDSSVKVKKKGEFFINGKTYELTSIRKFTITSGRWESYDLTSGTLDKDLATLMGKIQGLVGKLQMKEKLATLSDFSITFKRHVSDTSATPFIAYQLSYQPPGCNMTYFPLEESDGTESVGSLSERLSNFIRKSTIVPSVPFIIKVPGNGNCAAQAILEGLKQKDPLYKQMTPAQLRAHAAAHLRKLNTEEFGKSLLKGEIESALISHANARPSAPEAIETTFLHDETRIRDGKAVIVQVRSISPEVDVQETYAKLVEKDGFFLDAPFFTMLEQPLVILHANNREFEIQQMFNIEKTSLTDATWIIYENGNHYNALDQNHPIKHSIIKNQEKIFLQNLIKNPLQTDQFLNPLTYLQNSFPDSYARIEDLTKDALQVEVMDANPNIMLANRWIAYKQNKSVEDLRRALKLPQ